MIYKKLNIKGREIRKPISLEEAIKTRKELLYFSSSEDFKKYNSLLNNTNFDVVFNSAFSNFNKVFDDVFSNFNEVFAENKENAIYNNDEYKEFVDDDDDDDDYDDDDDDDDDDEICYVDENLNHVIVNKNQIKNVSNNNTKNINKTKVKPCNNSDDIMQKIITDLPFMKNKAIYKKAITLINEHEEGISNFF